MPQQPHLQTLNDVQLPLSGETEFSPFPKLPPEIRLLIWQHSMRRRRIIQLRLESRQRRRPQLSGNEDHFGPHGERFCAFVNGYQVLSKLLRVNSESRQAALSFYRVHIPCVLQREVNVTEDNFTRDIFYFNPEYDTLHILPVYWSEHTIIDFSYHLKQTFDPHRVGLLRLALDINDLNLNDLRMLEPSELSPCSRNSFLEMLNQLREVYFVDSVTTGRQVYGYSSGIMTPDTIFNRSFPVMATTPAFDILSQDPRLIRDDLAHLYMGPDPRRMACIWQEVLHNWGASPSQIQYRLLLGFKPPGTNNIFDRKSAMEWLKREDDEWTGQWRLDERLENGNWALRYWEFTDRFSKCQVGALHEKYRNENLEKAVKPAIGFWLFPLEVLGPVPESGVPEAEWTRWPDLCDATGHWPELALQSLQ